MKGYVYEKNSFLYTSSKPMLWTVFLHLTCLFAGCLKMDSAVKDRSA